MRDDDLFPFSLAEGDVEVQIDHRQHVAEKMREFTEKVFSALKRPGVDCHPRAFMRLKVGKRRGGALCPASFPTPSWARAVIEQIAVDTSGMQPRFFYNDRAWLEQPAIYCNCYFIVTEAKRIVDEWVEDRKRMKKGAPDVGRRDDRTNPRSRHRP